MSIQNDKDFRAALAALPITGQRQVAARFVRQVLDLCGDVRVRAALAAAERADISAAELVLVAQSVHSARVESYTQCGRDTGWAPQAGHFVAKAAEACVRAAATGDNLAWDAAMQARLARTCQTVAEGIGTENNEAQAQYQLLDTFLKD
ncbi:MAG: hypothetical protein PHQ58_06725 [Rhodoferax sp.]|uniref:hypothetical protein n=1 Tax=Rhodoferax sp. TaxID=50421 RepID=UPI00262A49B2|nr:hypothetical protein [Rhodoferax sp.]MDD2880113.1 hypothetical protein [Rhodoferax sp.]